LNCATHNSEILVSAKTAGYILTDAINIIIIFNSTIEELYTKYD